LLLRLLEIRADIKQYKLDVEKLDDATAELVSEKHFESFPQFLPFYSLKLDDVFQWLICRKGYDFDWRSICGSR